jgi:protein-tyrosine phosphatase
MSRFIDYISALYKVGYDKSADYIDYYTSDNDRTELSDDMIGDSIIDYQNVIDAENFEDEETNKRIYKKIGFFEEVGWLVNSKPTHIIDNLYLGNAVNAGTYYMLKDMDISVIVNVTKEISNYFPEDFIYERYDIYDDGNESIEQMLEQSYQSIKTHQSNDDGNILIHCHMGASRSATVIMYYLMKEMKNEKGLPINHNEALEFLKQKRPIINPTFRFTKDLAISMINDTFN